MVSQSRWTWVIALAMLLAACSPAPATVTPTPTELPAILIGSTATASMPLPPDTPTPAVPPAKIQHTIQSGDTLLGLARQYHVSIAAIQLANNMGESTAIFVGQTLAIPDGPTWPGESAFWSVHVVRAGETLANIAQTFNVKTTDLARINNIADPSLIKVGQAIVIPVDAVIATAPPTPTRTRTPPPTLKPATAASLLATPTKSVSPLATPSPRPTTPTVTTTPVAVSGDTAGWPNAVVALVNQKRAAHGLLALRISPELMRAAQAHADDCKVHDWCGHTTPDGSDTRTRLVRAGYTPTFYGENWMQANDPTSAVNWWYNETPPNDPHRQNLLNTHYADIGIGIAKADYGYYFIANFASR